MTTDEQSKAPSAAPAPTAPQRPAFGPPPRRGPGGGGPMFGGMGMPAEKSLNFGPSLRRLLAPDAPRAASGCSSWSCSAWSA